MLLVDLDRFNLAARFGGDEFAILVNHISSPEDAFRLAERILRTLGQPLLIAGQRLHINASIGVALSTPETYDPAEPAETVPAGGSCRWGEHDGGVVAAHA